MSTPKPIICEECGETILPCSYTKCDDCFHAQDVVVVSPGEWQDLLRRAEIGARAVEVLHQAGIGRWPMLDKQFRSDAEPILADARDAGMVP